MKKILKFEYSGKLVLLSLDHIALIQYTEGDETSGYGYQMVIYTTLQEKYPSMFSFYLKKKNKDIIVQAIEDFYNNEVKVWEIGKELPFIS
jgi:hypothetical protein